MLLAPILWVFTVVICYIFAAKIWWFPPPINQHGFSYDAQFSRVLVATGIIFFLAQIALGWVVLRYRDKGGRAVYSHGNNRLEALWTSATAVLFVGLVLMGTRIFAGVHFAQPPADALQVEVLAKQFAWNFRYPGPDGKFGRTVVRADSQGRVSKPSDAAGDPFGLDEADPAAKDDIVSSSLKVPVGKPVRLLLHSRDVIHNFFVRELRLKQDVVPGMEIPLHFQADRIGVYEVPCSELCGLGHHQMRTTLQVVSAEDFEKWKQEQAAQK